MPCLAILGAAFLASVSWSYSQPAPPSPQEPSELKSVRVYHLPEKTMERNNGQLAVADRVSYQEINLDHLALNLFVRMNPVDRPATVVKVYFQDVLANGLPVHIQPYDAEFQLSRTAAVDLPTPLRLSLVFAEIDSLEPLRKLVNQDTLHLTGKIFILVRLTALESVVMRTRQVVLPFDLDQTVPMHMFSDEPMIQSAVLTLLNFLSTPYSEGAAALAKRRQQELGEAHTLSAAAAGRLFLAYCAYSLRNPHTHDVQRFEQSGTAFLIDADGTLLTAKRVVQPWKFDPQILSLLNDQGYELEPKDYRLAVWPAGAPLTTSKGELDVNGASSTEGHTLELWKLAPDSADAASPAGKLTPQPEGANDLALLKMTGAAAHPAPLPVAAGPALSATLLAFPFGADQEQAKLAQISVKLESGAGPAGMLRLTSALEPGEAGGALMTPDGQVLAICGGPRSCMPLEPALRSLQSVAALSAPSASGGKKEAEVRFSVERRETLVLSLEALNESLGAPKRDLPPEGVWQEVLPGGAFYTTDAARLKLVAVGDREPKPSHIKWYQRSSADAPWQEMGTGRELEFNIPTTPGPLLIRVEIAQGREHLSGPPVEFKIRQRLCSPLNKTILDDIALGVATFREAKATTRTYKQAFAENPQLSQQIAYLPDPGDPQRRPYQVADGDVVLHTGGPLGYVQRALGQPDSPQNHSGLIKIVHYNGKNIAMVNEIGWGYEYTPLTPADAAAWQQMKSLPQRPESFMESGNVGSVEVYRPIGMVQRGDGAWQPYPIGALAAERALKNGARAQPGYDFLFMESSAVADQPPFRNLYYCHEFTREAFGRKLAAPTPIPILGGLWTAARACDNEMAAANAAGGEDPAGLAAVLAQIDVDHMTFDPDPAKNEAARNEMRTLITSLQRFLGGESFERIVKAKIAQQLSLSSVPALIGGMLKGDISAANVGAELQRLLSDFSIADLAKSSGMTQNEAALLGAAFYPPVQAWIAAQKMGVANLLSDELMEDLGNAIDAKSLLAGGEAVGANGEHVRVTFKRISAPGP